MGGSDQKKCKTRRSEKEEREKREKFGYKREEKEMGPGVGGEG